MRRENEKNIQKTNEICYCLGGEISPPKGPEKNTVLTFVVPDTNPDYSCSANCGQNRGAKSCVAQCITTELPIWVTCV